MLIEIVQPDEDYILTALGSFGVAVVCEEVGVQEGDLFDLKSTSSSSSLSMSNMTPSGKSGECPDLSVFCRWSRCMASTKWTVSFIVRCLR